MDITEALVEWQARHDAWITEQEESGAWRNQAVWDDLVATVTGLVVAETTALCAEVARLREEADAGRRFKKFVHSYLDRHGVPHGDPTNQHQIEGCRIGARLDLLLGERARLRAALAAAQSVLWMAERYAEGGGSHGPEQRDYDAAMAEIEAALRPPGEPPARANCRTCGGRGWVLPPEGLGGRLVPPPCPACQPPAEGER